MKMIHLGHRAHVYAAALMGVLDRVAAADTAVEHPPKETMKCVAKVDPSSIDQVRTAIRAISDSGQEIKFDVFPDGSVMVPITHTGPIIFSLHDGAESQANLFPVLAPPFGLIRGPLDEDLDNPSRVANLIKAFDDLDDWPRRSEAIMIQPQLIDHYTLTGTKSCPSSKRGSRSAAKKKYWAK